MTSSTDPDRDAYLSWEGFAHRMNESSHTAAARQVVAWAIDVLAPVLGDDWLRGTAAEGSVPSEILYAESHTTSLAELIELALRLHLLANIDGIGNVRRELRTNLSMERRMHTRALLILAGLATMSGQRVALEAGDPPSDIAIEDSGEVRLVVEMFTSFTDQQMRSGMEQTDELMRRIRAVTWPYGVDLNGRFDGGSPDEEAEWFAAVEDAAKEANTHQHAVNVDLPVGHVEVIPTRIRIERGEGGFSGPQMHGRGLDRLTRRVRDKALQSVGAGGNWVHVDAADGLWQFTDWATRSLAEKGEVLAQEIRRALEDVAGLNGVMRLPRKSGHIVRRLSPC